MTITAAATVANLTLAAVAFDGAASEIVLYGTSDEVLCKPLMQANAPS